MEARLEDSLPRLSCPASAGCCMGRWWLGVEGCSSSQPPPGVQVSFAQPQLVERIPGGCQKPRRHPLDTPTVIASDSCSRSSHLPWGHCQSGKSPGSRMVIVSQRGSVSWVAEEQMD